MKRYKFTRPALVKMVQARIETWTARITREEAAPSLEPMPGADYLDTMRFQAQQFKDWLEQEQEEE